MERTTKSSERNRERAELSAKKRRRNWSPRPPDLTSRAHQSCFAERKISCDCYCHKPGKMVNSGRPHLFWFGGREPLILETPLSTRWNHGQRNHENQTTFPVHRAGVHR